MNPLSWSKLRRTNSTALVHSLLIMIGATYLEVAVYMMILWQPMTLEQCFGAALLGWGCALVAYTRLQRRAAAVVPAKAA